MTPIFFNHQDQFRAWLAKNHAKEVALMVGFYKVHAGIPSMTWSESVDQALCFGWIDGVRKSISEDSYQIRFTPRKQNSIWSAVNINKVQVLTEKGLMTAAGMESFKHRKDSKSGGYSFKNDAVPFLPAYEKEFKANKAAWNYFQALAASYRKTATRWVMGAKQEATQIKRLQQLITDSEKGQNIWKDNKYKKTTK